MNRRLSKKDVEKAKKLNFVMPDPDPVSPSLNNEWRFCPDGSGRMTSFLDTYVLIQNFLKIAAVKPCAACCLRNIAK